MKRYHGEAQGVPGTIEENQARGGGGSGRIKSAVQRVTLVLTSVVDNGATINTSSTAMA
jgi:hypothetical protein